eukprot:1545993-Prymnesium_polylepis.3
MERLREIVHDGCSQRGKQASPVQNHRLRSCKADLCSGRVWSYPKMATGIMATGGHSVLNTALLVLSASSASS